MKRSTRFKLADTLSAIAWQWHASAVFLGILSLFALPQSLWLLAFPAISLALIVGERLLRHGYRPRRPGFISVKIMHVNSEFLTLTLPNGAPATLTHDIINRVAFYKADELTTDMIWCEIGAIKNDESLQFAVHEERDFFPAFESWLSRLPGFDAEWREKVVPSPFQENYTVVFERRG